MFLRQSEHVRVLSIASEMEMPWYTLHEYNLNANGAGRHVTSERSWRTQDQFWSQE